MTDKELLEFAAKAAGGHFESGVFFTVDGEDGDHIDGWNPLTDDGDALRLAVKLGLFTHPRFVHERDVLMFTKNMEKLEATRRAIVRAAAEIGKAMK